MLIIILILCTFLLVLYKTLFFRVIISGEIYIHQDINDKLCNGSCEGFFVVTSDDVVEVIK
jgi:hypothetical protein